MPEIIPILMATPIIAEAVSFYSEFAFAPPTMMDKVNDHPLVKAKRNKFR